MEIKQNIKLAVDAIVFGYRDKKLHVLLIQQKFGPMKDKWVLVGGFVKDKESLQDAVKRELQEEAGIDLSYLEQLYTFGDDIKRDPRMRVVSVAYYGLVNAKHLTPVADTDAQDAKWFPMDNLPKLGYDHNAILKYAHERLRAKLIYQPIGFDLLPSNFLFSDLENLYTEILGKEIDRRNFRKKLLTFGILEELKKKALKRGRPASMFKFNKKKYNDLCKNGFHFDLGTV
jgi:8-oxo-dGTP diphosphatase